MKNNKIIKLLILTLLIIPLITCGQREEKAKGSILNQNQVMTKEQLLVKLVRVDNDFFETQLYSKFLNAHVKVIITSDDLNANSVVVSDNLLQSVNDFLDYGTDEIDKIKEEIYNDYRKAIGMTDYAMLSDELLAKHKGDFEKANQEYFNINNKDGAFAALTFNYVAFVDYSTSSTTNEIQRYFGLFFERPWNESHELQLEFENGKFKQLL